MRFLVIVFAALALVLSDLPRPATAFFGPAGSSLDIATAAPGVTAVQSRGGRRGGQRVWRAPRGGGGPRMGGARRYAGPRMGGARRYAGPRAGGVRRYAGPRMGGARRYAGPRRSRGAEFAGRDWRRHRGVRGGDYRRYADGRGGRHYRHGRWHAGHPRWRGERRWHGGRYWRRAYDGWYWWDNAWIWAPGFGITFGALPYWGGYGYGYGTDVVVVTYEPWSDGWYTWCTRRYRSFNPATGYWLGFDGVRRFCIVR